MSPENRRGMLATYYGFAVLIVYFAVLIAFGMGMAWVLLQLARLAWWVFMVWIPSLPVPF